MRIGITGEKGFIATNLAQKIIKQGHEFVSLDNADFAKRVMDYTLSGEVCVYKNSVKRWTSLFELLGLDCIVHNAAVVGTDVVALNPRHAINTNVLGTQTIVEAANNCKMLIVYTGTTVIYDTYKYQETDILENSEIFPRTNYAVQKYAGEMIVRNNAKEWLVTRPLFAYGGVGDMNSLIAKSLFGVKNSIESIDMFLNPEKIKDYMHVEDFCENVMRLVDDGVRNEDFNITAENPHTTLEIISLIEEVSESSLEGIIKWHPETDYLGNHRLSNQKFLDFMKTSATKTLKEGIKESWNTIKNDKSNYNPLKYLDQAKENKVDLKKFFPK
ncbi:MAG: NAD(P)-dependent oxidoreductase [Bdellovibrionales bacterium]|jgi:dTDP-glucose 4,6-dehydratase|nr:NAD(P)-dependent oxidoreductase [Bdellovibrionales bacterium]